MNVNSVSIIVLASAESAGALSQDIISFVVPSVEIEITVPVNPGIVTLTGVLKKISESGSPNSINVAAFTESSTIPRSDMKSHQDHLQYRHQRK